MTKVAVVQQYIGNKWVEVIKMKFSVQDSGIEGQLSNITTKMLGPFKSSGFMMYTNTDGDSACVCLKDGPIKITWLEDPKVPHVCAKGEDVKKCVDTGKQIEMADVVK